MTLPNILTILRIICTFFFVFFIYQKAVYAKILAVIVFAVAALTDFLDGHIARTHNWESNFGKIMDPIADKFLVLSAFFVFADMMIIETWMFAVLAVREIVITALRLMAVLKGQVLAAESAGKIKTFFQLITISFILAILVLAHPSLDVPWFDRNFILFNHLTIYILMTVTLVLTVYSGVMFLWNNRTIKYV